MCSVCCAGQDRAGRRMPPLGHCPGPVRLLRLRYGHSVTGGSATVPEGELVVRLFDGAIGPTQLAQAQATASLDAAQRLSFSMDFAPAEPRSGGFARVTGSLPLRPAPTSTMLVTTGETPCRRQLEEHGQCLLEHESCLSRAVKIWPNLLLLLSGIRLTAKGQIVAVCHANLAFCKQSACPDGPPDPA